MPKVIAVVDDEPDILELVTLHLKKAGYRVEGFGDAGGFYRFISSRVPDLVVLDLALPDADGVDLCQYLRGEPRLAHVPVIMLTARAEETDRVIGLETGADDYVTKPFSPRELVSRVRAVLRRSGERRGPERLVRAGPLELDAEKFTARLNGMAMDLTATEFRLLELLCRSPERVYTRDQLIEGVWGYDKPVIDRTIDTHMRNLREKLGPAGDHIRTVRGIGYKFVGISD
ncbi:MAG TPA: response regulator transcription factor [candidate division WOR-3 bacterium]|uniref:Response regulator transcription factor n=1 Tax=candidate division WOR-3 bacterium TaxID=2052148 RepID=A0A7V0XFF5_UNCW3|nr:response regulator transcription factor [candidate division WOR-3 bacterium]